MRNRGPTQSLAVLIDADNTSARYAQAIFEEIVKFGEANVRRIYGDFSGSRLATGTRRSSPWPSCSTSSGTHHGARTPPISRW